MGHVRRSYVVAHVTYMQLQCSRCFLTLKIMNRPRGTNSQHLFSSALFSLNYARDSKESRATNNGYKSLLKLAVIIATF